jgi:hypothetical protein
MSKLRLTMLVVTLFVLAGAIAVGAVADHRHKDARMGPANVASWYCEHRGERCDEPQADNIEGAWQQRERVYRISFWALSLGGIGALVLRVRSREVRDPHRARHGGPRRRDPR